MANVYEGTASDVPAKPALGDEVSPSSETSYEWHGAHRDLPGQGCGRRLFRQSECPGKKVANNSAIENDQIEYDQAEPACANAYSDATTAEMAVDARSDTHATFSMSSAVYDNLVALSSVSPSDLPVSREQQDSTDIEGDFASGHSPGEPHAALAESIELDDRQMQQAGLLTAGNIPYRDADGAFESSFDESPVGVENPAPVEPSSALLQQDVVNSALAGDVPCLSSFHDLLVAIDSAANAVLFSSKRKDFPSVCALHSTPLSVEQIDQLFTGCGIVIGPHSLHAAVMENDLGLVYLIMRSRHRYLVNELDPFKRTPWQIALLNANPQVLQLLLTMPLSPVHADDVEVEASLLIDEEFVDLSKTLGGLPAFHLPLAKAGWTDRVSDVLASYALLIAYSDVVSRVARGGPAACGGLDLLEFACGWVCDEAQSPESALSDEPGPAPLEGLQWALERLAEFVEDHHNSECDGWKIDATDVWGATPLHKASEFGVAEVVDVLLNSGADPLIKDCNGDLPLHRAIDSADPQTFALLLRRGGTALAVGEPATGPERGSDPSCEETSMTALFKRCILRGSWRCLGRLVMDEVYSQFPIPEAAVDGLLEYAQLCGYREEFSEAFKLAVDDAAALAGDTWTRDRFGAWCSVKLYTHESCFDHLPLPRDVDREALRRSRFYDRYPENPCRLHCLTSMTMGVLRTKFFLPVLWESDAPPAVMADVLRVHDWSYIKSVMDRIAKLPGEADPASRNAKEYVLHEVDSDTPVTAKSWEAAVAAAGTVIAAVRDVCRGETRQAFCAVRPPGHHVGVWGACQLAGAEEDGWTSDEDRASGSSGFCLLNNVAIGAAFARYNFSYMGIRRVAIVDIDVHHGNGTEQIILNTKPRDRKFNILENRRLDLSAKLEVVQPYWKVWLDESDSEEIFFASIHGFGNAFYPGTGGVAERESFPHLHNISIPPNSSPELLRMQFRKQVIDPLYSFRPDIIFVSAGFDAHAQDALNEGYASCSEFDYYWMTRLLVSVANDTCGGRIVSVLEGGYNTAGGSLSALAQSISYHVKAFLQTPPGLTLAAAKLLDTAAAQADEAHLAKGGTEDEQAGTAERLKRTAVGHPQGVHKRRRAAAVKALERIEEETQRRIRAEVNSVSEVRSEPAEGASAKLAVSSPALSADVDGAVSADGAMASSLASSFDTATADSLNATTLGSCAGDAPFSVNAEAQGSVSVEADDPLAKVEQGKSAQPIVHRTPT